MQTQQPTQGTGRPTEPRHMQVTALFVVMTIVIAGYAAVKAIQTRPPTPVRAFIDAVESKDAAAAYRRTNLVGRKAPAGATSAVSEAHYAAWLRSHPVSKVEARKLTDETWTVTMHFVDGDTLVTQWNRQTGIIPMRTSIIALISDASLPGLTIDGQKTALRSTAVEDGGFIFSSVSRGYRIEVLPGAHHVEIPAGPATDATTLEIPAEEAIVFTIGSTDRRFPVKLVLSTRAKQAATKAVAARADCGAGCANACPTLVNYAVRKGSPRITGYTLEKSKGDAEWRVAVSMTSTATDNTPTFNLGAAFTPFFEGMGELFCGIGQGLGSFGGATPKPCPSAQPLPEAPPKLVTLQTTFLVTITSGAAKATPCPTQTSTAV